MNEGVKEHQTSLILGHESYPSKKEVVKIASFRLIFKN